MENVLTKVYKAISVTILFVGQTVTLLFSDDHNTCPTPHNTPNCVCMYIHTVTYTTQALAEIQTPL